MQNVLVTGGAGFIGSHLCKLLLENNYSVTCIDNFISSSKDNIKELERHPNFTFVEYDISKPLESIQNQVASIRYIFHLASPASPNEHSPRSYMAYPVETFLVNSYGTYQLLEVAMQHNARFVFASTSEVYGDPEISPQVESYFGNVNPNGPRAIYDESKRAGEAIIMAYVRKYNIDGRIARIFNTYGPHMQPDDGRVVSNLIVQALQNQPLTVYGKGSQTRSFAYVSDTVTGLYQLMFTDALQGEVVNIGNPIEKTIAEFATIIKELTGSSSEIIHQPLPADDPKKRRPDITKAKRLLHWEPKVSLEEGLKKTIEYFQEISNKQ